MERSGFTLLELLLVIFVMGMIAAMVAPALGVLDDDERGEITLRKMEAVRKAILGPQDRVDENGARIVGGFVGDMHRWPFLWEPRPESKVANAWETPSSMAAGYGQYSGDDANGHPHYAIDSDLAFFRPAGRFEGERWRWERPFRRLHAGADLDNGGDPANDRDHIGGPETENEGQPRELWTRYPEDLPFDTNYTDGGGAAAVHEKPGYMPDGRWKGPYLTPPVEEGLDDSRHYAKTQAEYEALEPVWSGGAETWQDGCYDPPSGALGEHFDDREKFRLLQTEGRLTDGWGRALRFFITDDPDAPGETLFWIVSEGPDGEATYPNKGLCKTGYATPDPNDTMEGGADPDDNDATEAPSGDPDPPDGYNPEAAFNEDNVVMILASRDWRGLVAGETLQKEAETRNTLDAIVQAIVGKSPTGPNTGYTGDALQWPRLFAWEASSAHWDDKSDGGDAYVHGQPRGLWTRTPGPDSATDPDDELDATLYGVGWRHAYLPAPVKSGAEAVLTDGWGREVHCFIEEDDFTGAARMLVLSAGEDGIYTFGDPDDPTADVDVSSYDPAASGNADNLARVIERTVWKPGFLAVSEIQARNATTGATKCRLFGVVDSSGAETDVLLEAGVNGVFKDADGDAAADDWVVGDASSGALALQYSDATAESVVAGARYLVVWDDDDDDDAIDSGESGCVRILAALGKSADAVPVVVDAAADFAALP